MKTTTFFLLFFLLIGTAQAAHQYKEKEYQDAWCSKVKGQTEYKLDDNARVDCLTEEYAIEFDFAPKWGESIGQALYYGLKTGKTPGVVLIMEDEANEGQFFTRLKMVADKYQIKVWKMTGDDLKSEKSLGDK